MAKSMALTGDDLTVKAPKNASATPQRGEGEGKTPSAELIPLQFRMSPEFVQAFKLEAVKRRMKLNELLKACFQEFMKEGK